jgi:hypothetical protein
MKIKTAIFLAILFFATGVAAQQNTPSAAQPCSLLSGPCQLVCTITTRLVGFT